MTHEVSWFVLQEEMWWYPILEAMLLLSVFFSCVVCLLVTVQTHDVLQSAIAPECYFTGHMTPFSVPILTTIFFLQFRVKPSIHQALAMIRGYVNLLEGLAGSVPFGSCVSLFYTSSYQGTYMYIIHNLFFGFFPWSYEKCCCTLLVCETQNQNVIVVICFQVIGSSLLVIYDTSGNTGVWIIDFSKTVPLENGEKLSHLEPWSIGNHEDGFLMGLDSIIEVCKVFDMFLFQTNAFVSYGVWDVISSTTVHETYTYMKPSNQIVLQY